MTGTQKQIIKKLEDIPEIYLREILDFVDFIRERGKKNRDTEYLAGIKGMTASIKKGRKEKAEDCKSLEDIGWR